MLSTKYRPTDLDSYIGHEDVVESVRKALKENRGRTFLLTGPSGIGKTTLARIIAHEWGVDNWGVIEIDAATYTGIDEMRNVMDMSKLRGFGNPKKLVIIDEAHALSRQAIQSLLKSLEEPPEHLMWVLATTESSKIPKTIKTRCLAYDLKPIPVKTLYDYLVAIDELEDFGTDPSIIQLAADKAAGSPRQALENLGIVGGLTDERSARRLLEEAEQPEQVIDLCRALAKSAPWPKVAKIVKELEVPPETVRLTICSYFSTVALNSNSIPTRALEILDAFSTPCNIQDKMAPIILALGRVYFGE
jgi:DNA polymerase-3 subunit gamma/tau